MEFNRYGFLTLRSWGKVIVGGIVLFLVGSGIGFWIAEIGGG